jgi:hypothetical protein
VLPLVALVHNSTLRGRALPRWMRDGGVILLVLGVILVVPVIAGFVVGGG